MALDFSPLKRCIDTLDRSLTCLASAKEDTVDYEMYRNSVVKSFEMTLEIAGRSLRRALREYDATPKSVNELTFKDVLRNAAKRGLLVDVDRWFTYRDSRNNTVHDYGESFASTVLVMVHQFRIDVHALYEQLVKKHG
jgi:nucleotidyltransferase substrate binding protein (TIGR01987 family)